MSHAQVPRLELARSETAALVVFWRKYMAARKHWESLQQDVAKHGGHLNSKVWQDYMDAKHEAFNELVLTIPEIRYTDFWRDVVRLQPQACVDGILRYRREKSADREQRQNEKQILAATATKGKK